MKRVIPLAFILALTGCNQDADTATASLNTAEKIQPQAGGKATDSQTSDIKMQVFQFGIYKATKKGQITDSTETNTGKVVRKPTLEHFSMTDRIPLVKETYFGYQFRLWNLPPEVMIKPVMQLRKVLIHPEMTLPDGSKTTGWDRTFKGRVEVQQVMGFDGYGFNEDYELVEGDWIFQIWYQGKKLIERKFVSVWPEQEKTAEAAEKE
ncbi:MAG: DUF3859 domain-containing protein [Thermotogales bacterium]|nr:DUF3859 domain-containing protein [Thermotogales bacterium]